MRILFFSTFFDFRGEPTNLADEVLALIKLKPETEYLVYTVGPFNKKNRVIKYSRNIILVERKNLRDPKVFFLFLKDMKKIFIKFKPQIIHSVYVIESLIMGIIGKIFRTPSIMHGRGTDVNYFPFKRLKSFILAKFAFKLNNQIITVSKSMKNDIMRLKVPSNKIIPIYDGLDFSDFPLKKREEKSKGEKFEILHANRFSPEKRQDLIIEVCSELRENNVNFHLTFIGYGLLEEELKTLIKKNNLENWITMAGFIEHRRVYEFMQKADLYIQPSETEGMPKSVYEAMYMELPIVMTNVGGMSELNIKPGTILIEVNNKEQLYNAIITYMNDPKKRKLGGRKNRQFILKNFNWELHAKKLYGLYKDLRK
ncbi:MAG: glycosyltransferase family 4 protein [Candidatus Hodarchaeota archaeon]